MAASGSVLETLYFLFSSNADELDAGAKKAKKSVDDLEAGAGKLGGQTDKLGKSFMSMATQAAGMIAAVVSVGAVARGVFDSINFADNLNEASERLGISVEELSVWGDAVKVAGGTSEGFQGSIGTLSASFAQLATTGKARIKPFLDELGISMKDANGNVRNVIEVLPELAKKFEGMSKQESLGFGKKLGLDDGTIMLLQRGGREVDDLIRKQKELGVVTKEDAQAADKFKDAQDDMAHALRSVYMVIGSAILPAITAFVEGITKISVWARENKTSVQAVFLTAATALTAVLIPALWSTAWGFIRTGVMAFIASAQILGFAGAAGVAAASMWAFMAPILLVVGGLALLYLAYEDVMTYLAGGASIIGDLIGWFKKLGAYIGDGLLSAVDIVTDAFQGMFDFIMGVINDITGGIRKALEYVGLAKDTTHEAIVSGQVQLATADSSPIAAQSSAAIAGANNSNVTRNRTTKIDKIEINTQATDADGIAGGINKSLAKEMNQAANNYDDGVER